MIRREFLKASAMTAAGFLIALKPVLAASPASQRNESRPNILWITCEDKAPWTIYDGPTRIRAVGPVEVVAHRIGFKPSPPVVAQLPRK